MAVTTARGSVVPPELADRNRAVDLLRVAALLVVVVGHWLMQGFWVDDAGGLHRTGMLSVATWSHPLTWVLQVMPVFFLVGGYANAVSWDRARRRQEGYGVWLRRRVTRLTRPLLPLMVLWTTVAFLAEPWGLDPDWVRIASKASLVPTWFLATYLFVVLVAPATMTWWRRAGWWSIGAGVGVAALLDAISISTGSVVVGGFNVIVVWTTMHQVGCAWWAGAFGGTGRPARPLVVGGVSGAALVTLVWAGPYGVSMVGVEGFGVSNTYPPRVTLLLLGLLQAGVAVAAEPLLQRLAARPLPWAVTVVLGTRLMTVYLWHLTAYGLLVGVALANGGVGLHHTPDSAGWWWSRPAWFACLAVITAGLVAALARYERGSRSTSGTAATVPVLEVAVTVVLVAMLAGQGIVPSSRGDDGGLLWQLPAAVVVVQLLARTLDQAQPRRKWAPGTVSESEE